MLACESRPKKQGTILSYLLLTKEGRRQPSRKSCNRSVSVRPWSAGQFQPWILAMEVIETKPVQPTNSGRDSWPEAPDLQLDCFSSDEEETIDESEPESTSSDDSSVKEITKSPQNQESIKESIVNNNSNVNPVDCKPGTSRGSLIQSISSTVRSNPTASQAGTSAGSVVPTPLIKCPEAGESSTSSDPLAKSGSASVTNSKTIGNKIASRNGHLVIDLTNSDDESNTRNKSEQRRNSNAESAARRVHHARRSGRHLAGGSNARMSCIQESAPGNRHHPGFMPNPAGATLGSVPLPLAPCRYLPQHAPNAQPTLQAPHTSVVPQSSIPEIVNSSSSNSNDPCSYSNCFVASPSNGNAVAAPPSGPCPHNHGYCPVPSTQHFLIPTNAHHHHNPNPTPQFVLPPTLVPPTNLAPNHPGGHHHHPMLHHYAAYPGQQQQAPPPQPPHPPVAHTRIPIQPFTSGPPTNGMSPAHLQTFMSQYRRAELERQRYMQHEIR